MTNFDQKLKEKLKQNMEFWDEEIDDINRNEIIDRAYKVDKDLIGILIDDKEIRETFFDKIKEYWIFNVNKFVDYIENIKVLSNSYTKFKNIVGLNVNGKYLNERGEVSLVWPFKDCVLEGGMTKEDQKRNEIFFNEILAKDEIDRLFDAKVLTNFKKYTAKGEEKVKGFNRDEKGTIKDNLIIKGNNLLALHSLKKEFAGKVKLIYIDPPYNTKNDSFTYNDRFKHSTWLTFMKNRLEVARNLLRDEGIIFVQCDENEQAYLKILLDEIFNRDNFISNICIFTEASQNGEGVLIQKNTEAILTYSKNKSSCNIYRIDKASENLRVLDDAPSSLDTRPEMGYTIYWNSKTNEIIPLKDYDKDKIKTQKLNLVYTDDKNLIKKGFIPIRPRIKDKKLHRWRWGFDTFKDRINEIVIKKTNGVYLPYFKQSGDLPPRNIINCGVGTKHLNSLFGEKKFNFPKPESLIKRLIEISTLPGEIVLDYHLGSGTTCAVAHKIGRQYIGVEQMDYIESVIIERLKKVINGDDNGGISKAVNWKGGGEFVYCELLKYNEDAIDKIQDAKDTKSLLKIWKEMIDKYFLNYDVKIHDFDYSKFEKMTLKQQKDVLVEMLNKNQLYVNLSEIGDSQFKVSKEDKELNKKFYGVK